MKNQLHSSSKLAIYILSIVLTSCVMLSAFTVYTSAKEKETKTVNNTAFILSVNMPVAQPNGFITQIDEPDADSVPISTKEQLANIKNDLTGKYHLTSDIYLDGMEWVPIGNGSTNSEASYFTGVFDGQGHIIHDLKISGNYQYKGLFGIMAGATIKNTGLENTNITTAFSSGYTYAGGICGFINGNNSTVINNCYNKGSIEIDSNVYDIYTGGIFGYSTSYNLASYSIANCYNEGSISASSKSNAYTGGIFAYGYNTSSTTVTNCYNTGELFSVSSKSNSYIGGICGYSENYDSGVYTISGCYNMGDIYAYSSHISYVGGICGYGVANSFNPGSGILFIKNCYNSGRLSMEKRPAYIGGICGYNETANSNVIVIRNCYNKGEIFGYSAPAGDESVWSDSCAGGICGVSSYTKKSENRNYISYCYNEGTMSASHSGGICGSSGITINYCYNKGTIAATKNAGGITGSNVGWINNCYNKGSVSSEGSPFADSSQAGGISGFDFEWSSISNCYNTGEISAFSSGFNSYAGGIIGTCNVDVSTGNIAIARCYNVGGVSAASASSSHWAYVGGICGAGYDGFASFDVTPNINFSYWNSESNQKHNDEFLEDGNKKGIGANANETQHIMPLSSTMMKQKSSFTGFDFDAVWWFNDGENNGYPVLRVPEISDDDPPISIIPTPTSTSSSSPIPTPTPTPTSISSSSPTPTNGRNNNEKKINEANKQKVSGLKLASKKKQQLTVSWKKNTKCNGYQIFLAQDKRFSKGKKTISIAGAKTIKKQVNSLKSKKKYYVKIRTYTTINQLKVYGTWSKITNKKVR